MNHQMRRFSENVFVQLVKAPGLVTADAVVPASNSYIHVAEYERFAFLIVEGTTDLTELSAQVLQATAVAGTGSKNLTNAVTSVGNFDTGNKWTMIEVERSRLDIQNNFDCVALNLDVTGGTTGANLCVLFLGWRTRKLPPTFGADKSEIVYIDG